MRDAQARLMPKTFGRNLPKAAALVGVCAFVTAASWFGVSIDPDSFYEIRFHQASFILLPLFSACTVFVTYWILVPLGPPVIIDHDGFTDRRVSSQTIPWDQITNVVRKGIYVSLTLRRSFTPNYSMSWRQKLLKARRKSAGPNHVLISVDLLRVTESELTEAIQAMHTQFGRSK